MKHSFSFFFSSFSVILLFEAAVGNIVEDTCKKVNVDYNFCVQAFGEDPSSNSTADLQGLGIISVNLIISNASQIVKVRIEELLANQTGGPDARPFLVDCQDFYMDAISYSHNAIDHFKSKDYGSAIAEIVKAKDESDDCKEDFEFNHLKFPLEKESTDFTTLTLISRGIAELLQ